MIDKKFEGGISPREGAEELSTPEQIIKLMESSRSEKEWDDNCDKVRARFNGYPNWWYEKIIASGLATKIQVSWEK